ncbi:MAG: C39 family peptidase, partial [Ignavibacteriales bacterium]
MIARILLLFFLSSGILFSQTYPDQFYNFEKDSLVKKITTMSGIQAGSDGKSIVLSDGALSGYAEFQPDSSAYPFNQGLPSWNGRVPNDNSSFRVLMRFYTNGWSPWLTAGYWKAQIWSSYGTTSYAGGRVNIDEIEMNSYCSKWQFRVEMMRTSASQPSPKVQKLSFFVSDTKTTTNYNLAAIVNDKPASVFIPTQHFYQYALDPEIGGSICSPTSVSMVIRSYNIKVDPLQFARDNYDNYFGQFGLWPRVVQHAAEFGLKGAVTRYRTWSEARKVLAAGGRVVMSVG